LFVSAIRRRKVKPLPITDIPPDIHHQQVIALGQHTFACGVLGLERSCSQDVFPLALAAEAHAVVYNRSKVQLHLARNA
jgi:hypothetical protein